MKFLIIQTAFIGDVVLATPLIEKLGRFYPEASIDFLLRKGNEKLLSGNPHIREILVWDKRQSKYAGLAALVRRVRSERYDWVINCQRFAASGLLTALSGAGGRVGFRKNPFAFAFTRRVAHVYGSAERKVHEVDRNLALIEHLTDGSFERPRLYPSDADAAKASALADGHTYICIAPTSVWFTKQFPIHKWLELLQRLPSDRLVFLLGAGGDTEACEAIRAALPHRQIVNLAGKLSLLESAALMQGAAMNYANDSAPVHIASALNAPIAAVFCSTVPAFGFTPLSDRSMVVEVAEALPCRPCGLHGRRSCPQGHFACAERVDAADFPV